jgi:3-oxoacyl-(acyl-carrier-protein) synthase
MVGHCLSGAGSIESVATVLQLHDDFIFPNCNCEDLHPEITEWIDPSKIPTVALNKKMDYIAKASFGFGDVNACIIFKKWKSN